MTGPGIFIGICYHKDAPVVRTSHLRPIHVGSALSKATLDFAERDDSGDNISHRNRNWCELTGLYWMWKNVDAEHYGLLHYRRLLNFRSGRRAKIGQFYEITDSEIAKFGWDDENVRKACASADILTAPMWNVHPVGAPEIGMTNYEFYKWEHYARDMDVVEEIVASSSPHMRPFLIRTLTERRAFFGNITVMRKRFFHEYCEWLFDILFQAEARIDLSGYDAYQRRIWGFIAERLTLAYVEYAESVHGASRRELPQVSGCRPPARIDSQALIARTRQRAEATVAAPHATDGGAPPVNVVMAVNSRYAPHAAAMMQSALTTTTAPARLHFHLLDGGALKGEDRDRLTGVAEQSGARLAVVPIDDARLRWLPLNRSHVSLQTYYRLLIPEALPQEDRVLYLDADMIVLGDLQELWDIPLNGKPIAGAPDEGGAQQNRRLRLPVAHRYFNAGVGIYDLVQMRNDDLEERTLQVFRQYGDLIRLQDQDLLNILYTGRTQDLPLAWNVNSRIFLGNSLEPAYGDDEAAAAAANPKILHFTSRSKPWDVKCQHPLAPLYWLYRNRTEYRETGWEGMRREFTRKFRDRLIAKDRRVRRTIVGAKGPA